MSLVWHIVKKDLRRTALPVALWIVCAMAITAIFSGLRLPAEMPRTAWPTTWALGVGQFFSLATILVGLAGAVLTGFFAQEDSPVGTTAFWQTRPISGGRLLAAKVLGAALLFVIAPALAMMAVWAADGFSMDECAAAAIEFMAWQLIVIVPSLALGAATSNLGKFLSAGVAAVIVLVISQTKFIQGSLPRGDDLPLDRSRMFVVLMVALAGASVALVWRYLSRRSNAHRVLAATALTMLVIGSRWSTDLTESWPWLGRYRWSSAESATIKSQAHVRATWGKLFIRKNSAGLMLDVENGETHDGIFAPTAAHVSVMDQTRSNEPTSYIARRGAHWGAAAALRLAGFSKETGALPWEIDLSSFPDAVAGLRSTSREVFSGSLAKIALMKPEVLWEIPLRAGEDVKVGSSFTRIVEVGSIDGQRAVLLHERDARLALEENLSPGWYNARRLDDAKVDCFLVVNRARGTARIAALEDLGVVGMNSLMISISALRLPLETESSPPADWKQGTTLLKVRFKNEGFFVAEVSGGPVTIVEEAQP